MRKISSPSSSNNHKIKPVHTDILFQIPKDLTYLYYPVMKADSDGRE